MVHPSNVKKVLVVGPHWVGDSVFFLPAVKALKQYFLDAKFSLLARQHLCALHAVNPLFDEVLACPWDSYLRAFLFQWKLRSRRYDLAVLFPDSFSSALGAFLTGAKRRLGRSAQGRDFLLTDTLSSPKNDRNRRVAVEYLDLARLAGAPAEDAEAMSCILPPSKEGVNEAARLFAERGLDASMTLIGLCPGAAFGPSKRWPASAFAGLVNLIQKKGWQPVVIGSTAELPLLKEVAGDSARVPVLSPSLPGLLACLGKMNVVVANDSGPLHLAAVAGRPCIGLYGPISPAWSAPLSEKAKVIYRRLACSPCYAKVCPLGHHACLAEIQAEEVFGIIESLVAQGHAVH